MRSFHFRLIPFFAMLFAVITGLSLACWQIGRAHQKEAIEARLLVREHSPAVPLPVAADMAAMEYERVSLTGEFVTGWPLYLDNRPMNGAAGFYVLMPFKLQGQNKAVLIMRGWLARNAVSRTVIREYRTPAGVTHIEGMLRANSGHTMQLGKNPPLVPGVIIQNLDMNELVRVSHLPLVSFVVEQSRDLSGSSDGLLREWPRASTGADRHRGYAFQWLALAVMALLFFIVTGFKSAGKSNETR